MVVKFTDNELAAIQQADRRGKYLDPPRSKSTLSRGGTRCWCGNEKDRRSKNCADHMVRWVQKPDPVLIARDRRIRSMRANGCTLKTIAERYGITEERVRQICKKC